ncbi:autotransporter outer membrane beta-barrel domain-containing protein [Dyella sp. 2RAB6]|uniref:autotransporter outer membrane beta-barrel domain-containing protein n=1 Tax=Dyella sp. 2RAB6 TaxID=3232992 RepID=UPI003F921047
MSRSTILTNYGTIAGGTSQASTGGVGVQYGGPTADVTLTNYGLIKGGESLGGATGGNGISTVGSGSITNEGTIVGGTGREAIAGRGNIVLVNSGVIQAGTGANAIVMTPSTASLSLELRAGSTIFGNVVASTGTNDILRLGGATDAAFDVSSIDPTAQYQGFDAFQKTGTSTWTLTGTGTTATPWNIQQGTLQVGNGGTTGSFIGDVTNDGTLAFNRSDAFTFGNLISGSGSVSQVGSGITTLTGANTYTGGTAITAGTLRVGSDANLGDAAGGLSFAGGTLNTSADITSARTVALNGTGGFLTDAGTTLNLGGVISGAGSLSKSGDGTLVLTGTNTYAGGTLINGGELRVASDANLGAAAGGLGISGGTLHTTANIASTRAVLLNGAGTLLTDAGTTLTLNDTVTGVGSLTKAGDGTLLLANDNAYQGGTAISGGKLQLGNGGTHGDLAGNVANSGTLVFNRSDSLSFAGTISGNGAVTQAGTGTTIFSSAHTYTGATTIDAGRLAINGSITSPVTVNAAGTLGGTGTIFGNVTNAGTVAPGNSIGTLTIAGNYIGQGGSLQMETTLGGDSSPSDRLMVMGDTSGTTHVKVVNVGGLGAQTVEGIKLVDVRGASNGNFDLIGDYVFQGQQAAVAGAYAYRLYKGGVSTPNDGGWYLRSDSTQPTPPTNPPPTVPPPLYAPSVPIYEAYAGVLRRLNDAGTLQQRIGGQDLASDTSARSTGAENARNTATWVRVYGDHADLAPQTSTTGTHYDASTRRLQAGIDGLVRESEAGVLIAGATLQYGKVNSNVSSFYGLGRIESTAYGIGGTLTWYGRGGLYVDAQAQWNRYDTDLTSRTLGRELVNGNKGSGYNAGVEVGQKFALSERWSLIPQGQLTYASVDFNRFTDAYGASVRSRDGGSLVGRAGLAVDHEHSWRSDAGGASRAHVYGIANLYYDVLHKTRAGVADLSVDSRDAPLWGGLGVGGSLAWKDGRYQLYGEALAQTSLQHDGDSNSYSVRVGFRISW